jgi:hypothetical protein
VGEPLSDVFDTGVVARLEVVVLAVDVVFEEREEGDIAEAFMAVDA